MTTDAKTATAGAKKSTKSKARAASPAPPKIAADNATRSQTDVAIATELAPAVAIALLGKTDQAAGEPAAALEPLAAGAAASAVEGQLRVQLLFENGAVLPVELSEEAALALAKGIESALPKA